MISAEIFPLMKLTLQVKVHCFIMIVDDHIDTDITATDMHTCLSQAITKNSIKTFKKHQRDQAKKHKDSVFTTQESKTTIHTPSTFTIPILKDRKQATFETTHF